MTLHKEGRGLVIGLLIALALVNFISYTYGSPTLIWVVGVASFLLFITIAQFFRIPNRTHTEGENLVICPADGKVVVIEEVEETEYLKQKCIQVSIFMSPVNVHANYFPVAGEVSFVKYHPGKFLVAWHPKSSTENERTTVAVKHKNGTEILFRQIAGALARRIKFYCKEGDKAAQNGEFGFIKFGSRVDVFLPLTAKVKVQLDQSVQGRVTVLAEL
ncbi:MAG: phosphatidylserine decarboxylase family protein [Luteibaculaceae bacterium]